MHAYVATLRRQLVDDGVLVLDGPSYRLTRSYLFDSLSQAAATLLARNANGRTEWKDGQGRTLKQIQAQQVAPNDREAAPVP